MCCFSSRAHVLCFSVDLQYQTTLERQTVEKFSQRNGLPTHFVSAKTGEGVSASTGFRRFVAAMYISIRVKFFSKTN